MSDYRSVDELLCLLGYVDPYPKAGRWNKKAQKTRQKEVAKIDLKRYQVHSTQEWDKDGYIKVPVYEYNGIKYS